MIRNYRLADINLLIEMAGDNSLWDAMGSFSPFETDDVKIPDMIIRLVNQINEDRLSLLIEKEGIAGIALPEKLYRTKKGYYWEIGAVGKYSPTLKIESSSDFSLSNVLCLGGNYKDINKFNASRKRAFQRAIELMFSLRLSWIGGGHVHASTIIKNDKAILFHAKSGTGKSTHSQQWMKAFPDAELLNDDFPIVRVWPDGRVIAYGSPWSGKTPCYKNLSAPVAAFVRINRASENKIHRLSPVQAYASLLPSCTGRVKWNKEITDAQHQTLNKIISSVPCYQLDCLPNEDAARVCAAEVLSL